ncbi:hypothetical protein D915_009454 [Fasciola hepatica]|uniref:RAD51 interacting motif domain-containing protein n=1 Tax=Fasciola hepatica TaxID=6192 RepID=A0A4E0R7W8_FASHE|nr:hypothetical protein D915_009454 [Fasciola hepatica]
MAERRSGRARKPLDYSKLDGESDEEFFDVKLRTPKRKQIKDEEWNEAREEVKIHKTKLESKPPVIKNLPVKPAHQAVVEVVGRGKENENPTVEAPAVPCAGKSSLHRTEVRSKTPSNMPPVPKSSTPTPITSKTSPLYAVTPPSGLRLGLSRTQKLRPLHRNIRISY